MRTIFSGVCSATSSMSMPPASLAITTTPPADPSMTIPTYSSRSTSSASSTRTERMGTPSGPVWCVTRFEPISSLAAPPASSGLETSLMPPALPRPPAWTCALTTTDPPNSDAAATAASAVSARPRPSERVCRPYQESLSPGIRGFSIVGSGEDSRAPRCERSEKHHPISDADLPQLFQLLANETIDFARLHATCEIGSWRREWDSNPRYLSVNLFSRQAP